MNRQLLSIPLQKVQWQTRARLKRARTGQEKGSPATLHSGALGLGVAAALLLGNPARAVESVAAPVLYPADVWQGRGAAVITILNRIDSHIEQRTVLVGDQVQYRSLHLKLNACLERPSTVPSDAAMQLTLTDDAAPKTVFDGWFFAQEPGLTTYKSALYGFAIVRCSGPLTAPYLAPLPQATAPIITTKSSTQNTDPSPSAAHPVQPNGGPIPLNPLGQNTPQTFAYPTAPHAPSRDTQEPQVHAQRSGPLQLAPLSAPPAQSRQSLSAAPGGTNNVPLNLAPPVPYDAP